MAESEIDNDNSIFDVNETEEITIVNQSKLDLAEPAHSFLRYYSYVRGEKVAKCRLCKKLIGRKDGSTTGMERHLRTHT
uniref:BED-type domain-containing protein n=1 Tax=Meloidogyne javanica TaxID=6303 RepID=A0A915MUW9_MELJA